MGVGHQQQGWSIELFKFAILLFAIKYNINYHKNEMKKGTYKIQVHSS